MATTTRAHRSREREKAGLARCAKNVNAELEFDLGLKMGYNTQNTGVLGECEDT